MNLPLYRCGSNLLRKRHFTPFQQSVKLRQLHLQIKQRPNRTHKQNLILPSKTLHKIRMLVFQMEQSPITVFIRSQTHRALDFCQSVLGLDSCPFIVLLFLKRDLGGFHQRFTIQFGEKSHHPPVLLHARRLVDLTLFLDPLVFFQLCPSRKHDLRRVNLTLI